MSDDATSDDGIGRLTRDLYAAISGPAGAPRDWARHRELFADGAGIAVVHRRADGGCELERMSVAEYRATRQEYFDGNDFFEVEVARRATVAGDLANVLSHYESRRSPDGPPFEGGVNSLQLVREGGGWRIVSVIWEAGGPATALRRRDERR